MSSDQSRGELCTTNIVSGVEYTQTTLRESRVIPADLESTLGPSHFGDDRSLSKKGTSIPSRTPNLSNAWEFAGWGHTEDLELSSPSQFTDGQSLEDGAQPAAPRARLGQWYATSIAGNTLIASVFYTIGICFTQAGPLAPLSLLLVALVIYPFQKVLSEVSTALPLNGGTYTCLLNTASKSMASVAASLSLISYTATTVVSASSATAYLAGELPDQLTPPIVFWMTIGVLVVFAVIVALGMKESSVVASIIFSFHCISFTTFMVFCVIHWATHGSDVLIDHWNRGTMEMTDASGVANALFFGYCIGLLGVTGIETSSNYIEDQGPGVFPKTIRNLWWLAFFFNAPAALLTMAVLPKDELIAHPQHALSIAAGVAGGDWLRWCVTIDAVIVLCAGVLTSFIGVSGLVTQMANDGILPRFLSSRNRFTGSHHWIIISFLVICISLYASTGGNVVALSGVFASAFLGVLCTFSFGDLLLKYRRGRLPRPIRASTFSALFTLLAFLAALAGNMYYDSQILIYFIIYVGTLLLIMLVLLHRVRLAKTAFFYVDKMLVLQRWKIGDWLVKCIQHWTRQPVVFFADTDELHILNKAILYVNRNEQTTCLKIVHFYKDDIEQLHRFESSRRALDRLYPKLTIDLVLIRGSFNPENIHRVERKLGIPKSLMFMSCPGPNFPYTIDELGGVRIIML